MSDKEVSGNESSDGSGDRISRRDVKAWQDAGTLQYYYVESGLTQAKVGDKLGCTGVTIGQWLEDLGVREVDGEETVCKSCDRVFKTEKRMKQHHKRTHGESIAGVPLECEVCGDTYYVRPARAETSRCCSPECTNEYFSGENSPLYKPRPERICQRCGDPYSPDRPSSSRKYCSRQCANGYEDLTRDCEICGTEFDPTPSHVRERKANCCSPRCASIYRRNRVSFECDYCDGPVEKVPSREKYDDHHFCDPACSHAYFTGSNHPMWNGGASKTIYRVLLNWYRPRWELASSSAREQQDNICVVCGNEPEDTPDVHHTVPVLSGGTNSEHNLIPVCDSHHRKIEAYTSDLFENHFVDWKPEELPEGRMPSRKYIQQTEDIEGE